MLNFAIRDNSSQLRRRVLPLLQDNNTTADAERLKQAICDLQLQLDEIHWEVTPKGRVERVSFREVCIAQKHLQDDHTDKSGQRYRARTLKYLWSQSTTEMQSSYTFNSNMTHHRFMAGRSSRTTCQERNRPGSETFMTTATRARWWTLCKVAARTCRYRLCTFNARTKTYWLASSRPSTRCAMPCYTSKWTRTSKSCLLRTCLQDRHMLPAQHRVTQTNQTCPHM